MFQRQEPATDCLRPMSMAAARWLVYAAVCAAVVTGCAATDGVVNGRAPTTEGGGSGRAPMTEDGASGSGGESSCAALLVFRGAKYWGYGGGIREPKGGRVLGTGTIPGCDDGGSQVRGLDSEVRVVTLPGVDPAQAVMTNGGVWIADGAELPDVVRESRRPVDCSWTQPRQLTGTWISVVGGPPPQYDGDLNTPYRIGLVVDGADIGLPRWNRVIVRIQVVASTEPTLDSSDVRQALWDSGTLTAQVHCDSDDFIADSVTTEPP